MNIENNQMSEEMKEMIEKSKKNHVDNFENEKKEIIRNTNKRIQLYFTVSMIWGIVLCLLLIKNKALAVAVGSALGLGVASAFSIRIKNNEKEKIEQLNKDK